MGKQSSQQQEKRVQRTRNVNFSQRRSEERSNQIEDNFDIQLQSPISDMESPVFIIQRPIQEESQEEIQQVQEQIQEVQQVQEQIQEVQQVQEQIQPVQQVQEQIQPVQQVQEQIQPVQQQVQEQIQPVQQQVQEQNLGYQGESRRMTYEQACNAFSDIDLLFVNYRKMFVKFESDDFIKCKDYVKDKFRYHLVNDQRIRFSLMKNYDKFEKSFRNQSFLSRFQNYMYEFKKDQECSNFIPGIQKLQFGSMEYFVFDFQVEGVQFGDTKYLDLLLEFFMKVYCRYNYFRYFFYFKTTEDEKKMLKNQGVDISSPNFILNFIRRTLRRTLNMLPGWFGLLLFSMQAPNRSKFNTFSYFQQITGQNLVPYFCLADDFKNNLIVLREAQQVQNFQLDNDVIPDYDIRYRIYDSIFRQVRQQEHQSFHVLHFSFTKGMLLQLLALCYSYSQYSHIQTLELNEILEELMNLIDF